MIDLLLSHAADPSGETHLRRELDALTAALRTSAGRSDRSLVDRAEKVVRKDPENAFVFDGTGQAILHADGHRWHAGRFETVSIGDLRQRLAPRRKKIPDTSGNEAGSRLRFFVLDGAHAVTDIGSLQATAPPGTLFQVASQFNCLESPGPYLMPVFDYFHDNTQGPRASISAFPATLLRHYRAPAADGQRFAQKDGAPQINLLKEACGPGVVDNGYLTGEGVADLRSLPARLEEGFERIRVGVHDSAQVVRGHNWDGSVEGGEARRIAQVFTSTAAGGIYSAERNLGREAFLAVCRRLLRAAYLGTLLAAADLGRHRVVLTLIGGGVFGNPISLILQSIEWAMDQCEPLLPAPLEVVLNGFNLSEMTDLETNVLPAVRKRGGVIARFDRSGLAEVMR